jgi:hypothetical protein
MTNLEVTKAKGTWTHQKNEFTRMKLIKSQPTITLQSETLIETG